MGVVCVRHRWLVVRTPPQEMNTRILILLVCVAAHSSFAQGVFLFSNGSTATRIGAADGPLAGPGYWAQMLAGPTNDSLSPVGMPLQHGANGRVGGVAPTIVPNVPPYSYAFVQMVAWNGTLWGTALGDVPSDQLGRTDIVPAFLTSGEFPDVTFAPRFTQPAIVPVPEPSTWALLALGTAVLWCAHRRRR